jgi:uncharacterized protein YndB with AHSA1/START domain
VAIIKRTQLISAPLVDAFDVITDGESFASWNPTIRASRRLDDGPVGNGTRFEWDLRGFGKVTQELREFDRNRQVRIVPLMRQIEGGHRFRLSEQGEQTRIDHELEMKPKGAFVLFAPMMAMIGRKNLRDTANALHARLDV